MAVDDEESQSLLQRTESEPNPRQQRVNATPKPRRHALDALSAIALFSEVPKSGSEHNPRRQVYLTHTLAFLAGLFGALMVASYMGFGDCRGICSETMMHLGESKAETPINHIALELGVGNADPGSTVVHEYPPPNPTNLIPSMFPTTVGHAGPTPTGAEPFLFTAPAYPSNTARPSFLLSQGKGGFDILRKFGNLSPWYSVPSERFGMPNASPETPDRCELTGVHILHRHGARYPTDYASYGGPAKLATRLRAAMQSADTRWNATGSLSFLNSWTYKMGQEILSPFGRQQLYELGVSHRMKYGHLLEKFTEDGRVPVFRTESQDRMLASSTNFALGFFGWPLDGKWAQSVLIEWNGFNNTLAPYKNCPQSSFQLSPSPAFSNVPEQAKVANMDLQATEKVKQWAEIYLRKAQERLQADLKGGFKLDIEDVYRMQEMCAYETVTIGYSSFCELFDEEEWESFDYSMDLFYYEGSSYPSKFTVPFAAGYLSELIARLTHTKIENHNTSTNSTLDDSEITFPLNDSLYVDATHDVVLLYVITALNITRFNEELTGGFPSDHIKPNRNWRSAELAPFSGNIVFQLLKCDATDKEQIRILINDGVVQPPWPCPENADGLCDLDKFISGVQDVLKGVDWAATCF